MEGKPWMIFMTKTISATSNSINNIELNKTGITNNTVDNSANLEIFPGLVYKTTVMPISRISSDAIRVGNIICQKNEPAGAFFFSAMIPIL